MRDRQPTILDIEFLRGWIGREEIATDMLSEDLARKYHATFNFPEVKLPQPGDIAPRLIHFCLAQPTVPTERLGPDGHPQRGGFLPPVPMPRRMWAGSRIAFHGDISVGNVMRRISRIEDVVLKKGHTGPLCFVTVSHRIEAEGNLIVEEYQDIVYRDMDTTGRDSTTSPPAEHGKHRREMKAGAPLLFRYSALTFNSHSIHYDRRYATEVEGYPGLVVHGPLQATLLLNYATELEGRPPDQFDFRSLWPLFDHDAFSLHASPEGDGLKLWTAKSGGPLSMAAKALWR